jgi:hypothetical protein
MHKEIPGEERLYHFSPLPSASFLGGYAGKIDLVSLVLELLLRNLLLAWLGEYYVPANHGAILLVAVFEKMPVSSRDQNIRKLDVAP